MKVHEIVFSPTGGTRKAADSICAGMNGTERLYTDLCENEFKPDASEISDNDMAVVAMPVFGGRVPALAVERLRQLNANGARCVVVAVYGNRAYDDALLEMKDVATEMGFRVIAAIGAVAEHSIVREYGKGRPDADDEKELGEFGKEIVKKIAGNDSSAPEVPGKRPYKKAMAGPHPTAGRKCNACGVCAKECPTGAIAADNLRKTDKRKCISCMRCVAVCPQHARGIGKIMNFLIAQAIKKPCAARKENTLYI